MQYIDNSIDVMDLKKYEVVFSTALKIGALGSMALSPDGGMLAATVQGEKQVRFWDVRARKELTSLPIESGRSNSSSVAISPDGTLLAVTYEAGAGGWDLATRKEIRRLRGKESTISCPVFSGDGKRLVAGDGNGISMWDVTTGEPCHDFGHIYSVDALAF